MVGAQCARAPGQPSGAVLGALGDEQAVAEVLEKENGIAADVWSVTSWSELRRDGAAAEEATIFGGKPTVSYAAKCLGSTDGTIIAASDYVKAVPELIRAYLPGGRRYVTLGTDGFGRSDTRAALREHFKVDAQAIVKAAAAAIRIA